MGGRRGDYPATFCVSVLDNASILSYSVVFNLESSMMRFLEIYSWHWLTPVCVVLAAILLMLAIRYIRPLHQYETSMVVVGFMVLLVPFVQVALVFVMLIVAVIYVLDRLERKYDVINRLTNWLNSFHKVKEQ